MILLTIALCVFLFIDSWNEKKKIWDVEWGRGQFCFCKFFMIIGDWYTIIKNLSERFFPVFALINKKSFYKEIIWNSSLLKTAVSTAKSLKSIKHFLQILGWVRKKSEKREWNISFSCLVYVLWLLMGGTQTLGKSLNQFIYHCKDT